MGNAKLTVGLVLAVVLNTSITYAQAANEAALCGPIVDRTPAAAQSLATARELIAAKPGSATASFLNGCIAFGERNASKAAGFFEDATKKEEKSLYFDWMGRAYGDQAQKANKLKQPFLARKTKNAFEKAVELDPNALSARGYLVMFYQMAPGVMGGSEAKAREQLDAIRQRNTYRGGLEAANYYNRAENTAQAEKEYLALTRSHPDSIGPWNALVSIQTNAKRWADAIKSAESVHAVRPHLGDYMIGRIAALSGELLDRGEAAMRRYLTVPSASDEPTHANAHFRLGQIMQHRKDVAKARAEFQEALRKQPDHAEAKKALAAMK